MEESDAVFPRLGKNRCRISNEFGKTGLLFSKVWKLPADRRRMMGEKDEGRRMIEPTETGLHCFLECV